MGSYTFNASTLSLTSILNSPVITTTKNYISNQLTLALTATLNSPTVVADIVTNGGVEMGGEAEFTVSHLSRGGAEAGGYSDGSSTFEVLKAFPFSCGPCILYWWQVVGKCQSLDECFNFSQNSESTTPTEGSGSSDPCKKSILVNVLACNLSQLCERLRERGFNFEIAEIWKFTLPALSSEQNDSDCGTYVKVYPGPYQLPPDCLSYMLTNFEENWEIDFEVLWECGNGGLKFSGIGDVGNLYEIIGEGGIQFSGDALSFDLGTFESDIGVESDIVDNEIRPIFGDTIFPGGLVETQDVVANNCNCGLTPVIVSATHNLKKSEKLNNFLIRNNLVFPETIPLIYNLSNHSWQANYHFKGYGEDNSAIEVWDVLFEWACTDEVGLIVTDQVWKLGIYVKVKNLSTYEDYDTRLLMVFYPIDVCTPAGVFYTFYFNTETKIILSNRKKMDINIDLNTCYDNIGLFSDTVWLEDPVLIISVFQSGSPKSQKTLNISSLIPQRSRLVIP